MDGLALKGLPEVFDSVIDSGLFHVFSDEDRQRYVEGLVTVLKPGGRLFLLCFSDEEPGTQGPRRVSRKSFTTPSPRGGASSPTSLAICFKIVSHRVFSPTARADQSLSNRIDGFGKVHGPLPYEWGRLPFTSGSPVRKIAST
jgi:hypothetical protein